MKKIEIKFLESFFKLFKAKVTINEINNDNVFYGVVKWDDGEIQNIKWINIFNSQALKITIELCDFIFENKLIQNDSILISEFELKNMLKVKWRQEKIDIAIDCLTCVDIKMIDGYEETDSFFVHF